MAAELCQTMVSFLYAFDETNNNLMMVNTIFNATSSTFTNIGNVFFPSNAYELHQCHHDTFFPLSKARLYATNDVIDLMNKSIMGG
jgi:hypothetical protein